MLRIHLPIILLLASYGCSDDGPTTPQPESKGGISAERILPAHPLPGERGSGKADQFDDFKTGNSNIYGITTAPQTPMRTVAQWEQHEALLLTWKNSFPATYAGIVAATNPVIDIFIVHEGQLAKIQFETAMAQFGVSTAGIQYLNLKNDSVWMRDYGPFSVRTPSGAVSFVDARYYHTRIYDDSLPTLIGANFGVNVFRQPLNWEGGNFISDGQGNCYYTQAVLWYGGATQAQLEKYQRDYLGCETNIVLKPLANEGTSHIDMFAKLTSKNKMILGEYGFFQDVANTQVLNDNAAILTNATLNDGSSVEVIRIPMPSNAGQSVWRTYTNSVFANGVNVVPFYSDSTTYQAEALEVWQSTMPDWNHIPVDATSLITWSGSIHCISATIPSGIFTKAESDPGNLCGGSFSCTPDSTGAGSCELPFEGCCDDNAVQLCGASGPETTSCGTSGCGYSTATRAYACGGSGPGPSNAPLICGTACEPSCNDSVCGPDGCGGICGVCEEDQVCASGQCVTAPDPCEGITLEGCCNGNQIKYCDGESVTTSTCIGSCGWNPGAGWYDCGFSGADPSGNNPISCDPQCVPNCDGKSCGTDGCGGSCGTCNSNETCTDAQCICAPNCTDKDCGTDGCGGACGTCSDGQSCNAVGQCVGACTPNCEGKSCGADGCGGSCGSCNRGETCNTLGQCGAPSGCGEVTFEGFCTGSVLTWCDEENDELKTYDCSQLGDVGCAADPNTDPPDHYCIEGADCTPNCEGKSCGADGCGGSCGVCNNNETCEAGQCITTEDQCNGLSFEGCCNGSILNWCENGAIQTQDCQTSGCGWSASLEYYNCNESGDGPPEFPKACGGSACTPNCDGKVCGSDGCGGICGVCTGGNICEGGQCIDPCNGVPYEGECTGTALGFCEDAQLVSGDCASEGTCCGWDSGNGFYNCVPCGPCEDECETGSNGCSTLGTHAWICSTGAECNERIYTTCANGCDAALGACAGGNCVPTCDGKQCGNDGCGGSCGTCNAGSSCNASGQCVTGCNPSCEGKQCGDDGCGGSCGSCGNGTSCIEGQCQATACAPKCSGKVCGDDGCGGTCGTCPSGQFCDKFGACIDKPDCAPECAGKVCGDDGCGGICGVCGKEESCLEGLCVANPTAGCGGIPAAGICDGDKLKFCDDTGTISEVNCAAQGKTCGPSGTGFDCVNSGSCTPQCAGKVCGDDGCGGICGACSKGNSCVSGQCISDSCEPVCDGKSCGSDGCGGTCGSCGTGESCTTDGVCVAGGSSDGDDANAVEPAAIAESDSDGCTSGGNGNIPVGLPLLVLLVMSPLALGRRFA